MYELRGERVHFPVPLDDCHVSLLTHILFRLAIWLRQQDVV